MACELPPPGGGGKRGKTTKVFFPLLTPQTFLRTRLPAVARLNGGRRGHASVRRAAFGTLLCPEVTLRYPPRITVRGQTVQGACFALRKALLRSRVYPWSSKRPCGPSHFAARPKGVAAQRRVWGVKRGKGTIGALSPLVSAGRARHSSAVGTASPGRRRRPLRTLTPSVKSPSAARRCIGGNIPSAEGKEKRLRTGVRSLAVFSASAD